MTASMGTAVPAPPRAFGRRVVASAPGRTELAGNHTDHQGGHVLSATVSLGITGEAAENGSGIIQVESDGFPPVSVVVDDAEPRANERNTSAALVRGMAACFQEAGIAVRGFDLQVQSTLLAGGGLSSSAAFELMVGQLMNRLFADGTVDPLTLARWGKRTECEWFGKACGLQDQTIVASGGIQLMNFADARGPELHPVPFDFERAGYAVVLVDTHCDHSVSNEAFSRIPYEMRLVARELGAEVLGRVEPERFYAQIPQLREALGDRPVLRALHFFQEDASVQARVAALEAGDVARYLALTNASGRSSAQYLQNVTDGGTDQPAMVALALADTLLAGRGAFRIHGGGFGGSIQAYVPVDFADTFCARMDAWLGRGSCLRLRLGVPGAGASWR